MQSAPDLRYAVRPKPALRSLPQICAMKLPGTRAMQSAPDPHYAVCTGPVLCSLHRTRTMQSALDPCFAYVAVSDRLVPDPNFGPLSWTHTLYTSGGYKLSRKCFWLGPFNGKRDRVYLAIKLSDFCLFQPPALSMDPMRMAQ
ncbi:hypothetical protein ACLOJK_025162 [Asimina triloba]